MDDSQQEAQTAQTFNAILTPYRSLSPFGFLILMLLVSLVSFAVGFFFLMLGAWPVLGYFGLDVLLIYFAFKLNYRAGLAYEKVELSPGLLRLTQVDPRGRQNRFDFNPYWVRVGLREEHDGRTIMWLASHGREMVFGHFLTDNERREFVDALKSALTSARTVPG
ncbi:MAG: hypothetical protein APF80_11865 [Alphaproteobacteria bacterium BRH_c36]|nr:MAG: hypothetical protein APF80_11865 [Alphaproteobacteria bacterium BRH_c36]